MSIKSYFHKKFNNHNLRYAYLAIIAIFFFTFGYFLSDFSNKNIFYSAKATNGQSSFSEILKEIETHMTNSFISWKATSTLPTNKDLEYGMIKGYVDAYQDPYTQFFTPDESKQFEEDIKGSFGGIGAVIGYNEKTPVIMSTLKDNPAEKAGLKSGDILVSVNGKYVSGMSVEEIVRMVRGDIGTTVEIEIVKKGDAKTTKVKITRAEIKIPIIETKIINDVFVIHFYSFTEDSAQRFEKALQDFILSKKQYLIIDIRGNGGGYLESAIDISSFFLSKDKVIVIEKGNKTVADRVSYSKGFDILKDKKVKIVVLTDNGSASASEIVAGALKDNKVAKIVGEKTFGKGSVQELIKLSDGSDLKVTVAKWYTPNGVNISENGIVPDMIASSTQKIILDKGGNKIDSQLNKAISIIKTLK